MNLQQNFCELAIIFHKFIIIIRKIENQNYEFATIFANSQKKKLKIFDFFVNLLKN